MCALSTLLCAFILFSKENNNISTRNSLRATNGLSFDYLYTFQKGNQLLKEKKYFKNQQVEKKPDFF